MKQLFGFVLLIFVALMLLTVIGGMNSIFGSIASTWQPAQTATVADGLSSVLYFGGIVFVSVLGFALFNNTTKGSKGWSNSRPQHEQEFQVLDNPQQRTPSLLVGNDNGDWYDFEREEREDIRTIVQ